MHGRAKIPAGMQTECDARPSPQSGGPRHKPRRQGQLCLDGLDWTLPPAKKCEGAFCGASRPQCQLCKMRVPHIIGGGIASGGQVYPDSLETTESWSKPPKYKQQPRSATALPLMKAATASTGHEMRHHCGLDVTCYPFLARADSRSCFWALCTAGVGGPRHWMGRSSTEDT